MCDESLVLDRVGCIKYISKPVILLKKGETVAGTPFPSSTIGYIVAFGSHNDRVNGFYAEVFLESRERETVSLEPEKYEETWMFDSSRDTGTLLVPLGLVKDIKQFCVDARDVTPGPNRQLALDRALNRIDQILQR